MKSKLSIVWKFIYFSLPFLIFIASVIVVKVGLKNCYDYENKVYVINNNNFNMSDLIAILTFLFGTILAIDIHYYDQIEPKYKENKKNENDDEYEEDDYSLKSFLEGDKFKRVVGVTHIVFISIMNLAYIIQTFLSFSLSIFTFILSNELILIAVLFTDIFYIILCLGRQIYKWCENF